MKKTIKPALLLGALLAVATYALGATPPGVVRSDNGTLVAFTTPNGTTTPYTDKSRDPLIYGNLATKYPKGVYWCCEGSVVSGPYSYFGESWVAAAFTPTANATVTKVTVGVGYLETYGSFFDVLLSLNADNNGVPGEALKTWKINFRNGEPKFGGCCVVKSRTGSIPVTANTQYWVVLSTESDSGIAAAWNFGDYDEIDLIPFASYVDGIWTVNPNLAPAFAVYGH